MYRNLNTGVVEIEGQLTHAEANEIADMPSIHTLQFTAALQGQSFQHIDTIVLPACPNMRIRAYHFYGQVCDLAFVSQLPTLRRLEVMCEGEFANLEQIATLGQLQELRLRLYKLDHFDLLQQLTPALISLTLGKTASKKPSLAGISRFTKLQELTIEGHAKQIDELASLVHLQKLRLHHMTLPKLDFLLTLPKLWSLQLHWGGTNRLDTLAELKQLKYIDLAQIRGITKLDFISAMTGLQYIRIGAMPHVHELPALHQLHQLRKIELYNMKGLRQLDSLQTAPVLTEFVQREAWEMEADYYIPLLQNPALQRAYVHLRNENKMHRFQHLLEHYGKQNAATEQAANRESWLGTAFPFE
ncbi:hypothetical protein [Paenibacillus campi]|uniref:hypothetical protein n=1 Tax=Paenibacillus campi TaxID=3106031 RepID=UPI002AFF949D|nr:hypothetical protein [Paenibacillus sp. SGZ-1009]